MTKIKGNIFDKAQAEREQEQANITSEVTGAPAVAGPVADSKDHRGEKVTLSISEQDKIAVKIYAARNNTTISELLHIWITEHCTE